MATRALSTGVAKSTAAIATAPMSEPTLISRPDRRMVQGTLVAPKHRSSPNESFVAKLILRRKELLPRFGCQDARHPPTRPFVGVIKSPRAGPITERMICLMEKRRSLANHELPPILLIKGCRKRNSTPRWRSLSEIPAVYGFISIAIQERKSGTRAAWQWPVGATTRPGRGRPRIFAVRTILV